MLPAFITSLLGMLVYQSHLMSSLLCLKGSMLSMFVTGPVVILNLHFIMTSMIPIIFLVFTACKTAAGLVLLVMVSNTYELDYVNNQNFPMLKIILPTIMLIPMTW